MQLIQKKQGHPEFHFELKDDVLVVKTKSLTTTSGYEVPLRELSTNCSFHSNFPLLWYCFAAFATLCSLVSGFGVFSGNQLPDKAGAGILFAICTSVAMITIYEALRRKVDYVIINWEFSGRPAVNIHRKIPSERHVQEYIDILKEHILLARKKSELDSDPPAEPLGDSGL